MTNHNPQVKDCSQLSNANRKIVKLFAWCNIVLQVAYVGCHCWTAALQTALLTLTNSCLSCILTSWIKFDVIFSFKNEEVLKKCAQEYLSRVKKEEQRYQALKIHAEEKLDR